jgi:mannose-1-phosphate guanylyltransferase/phosphomannomutase
VKAVIMAGGKGTRLRPLTCSLPKPMVPLLNKPCMAYIIELLRHHGITDIAVTTQYMPEAIADHFGDGSGYGVRMVYFDETHPLGTAGSIKNAEPFLDERFIVISGDALTDIDLTEAVRFHERKGSAATMVLSRVEHPLEFGVVLTEPDGRIYRFLEKPDWSEVFSDTVNTGIYILEPELLAHIPAGREYDFSKELFPSLLASGTPLYGFVSDRYWSDIGSIDQYRQAHFDMLDGKVQVELDGSQIAPGVYASGTASIHPTSRIIGPAYIGPGAQLGERAVVGPYSVIGASARVGGQAVLDRSIIWHEAQVGDAAEMNDALLCNHVSVMPGARSDYRSVIGSHCVIGRKATVRKDVKLWPHKRIQDEAHVTQSLIWGDSVKRRLFTEWGADGIAGIEATPEFAVRFGAAYGSQLAPGSRLLLTASEHSYAAVLKDALASALRAIGIHCIDGGASVSEASRAYAAERELDGLIHVRYTPLADSGHVLFECCDGSGLPVDTGFKRKVEQALRHEDFRRPQPETTGEASAAGGLVQHYLRRFEAAVRWNGSRLGTVAVAADPEVFALAYAALHPGAQRVVHSGPPYDLTALIRVQADLRIVLEEGGRQCSVLTPEGDLMQGEELLLAALLAAFHARSGQTVGLPMQSPAVADTIAEGLGSRIKRTKSAARSVLQHTDEPIFHPLYNGIYAAALMIRHMTETGLRPDQLPALIPKHFRKAVQLNCPWDKKGSVLRHMVGGSDPQRTEMNDGLKIFDERGTIWIWPDADAPILRIIAESGEESQANDLLAHYVEDARQVLH